MKNLRTNLTSYELKHIIHRVKPPRLEGTVGKAMMQSSKKGKKPKK